MFRRTGNGIMSPHRQKGQKFNSLFRSSNPETKTQWSITMPFKPGKNLKDVMEDRCSSQPKALQSKSKIAKKETTKTFQQQQVPYGENV